MAPGAAASPYYPVAQGRAAASDLPPTSRAQPPTRPGVQPEPALAAARRRRAELLQSIHLFERALAVPAGNPNWHEQVIERLAALREVVTEHVVVTEGPDGLYN